MGNVYIITQLKLKEGREEAVERACKRVAPKKGGGVGWQANNNEIGCPASEFPSRKARITPLFLDPIFDKRTHFHNERHQQTSSVTNTNNTLWPPNTRL